MASTMSLSYQKLKKLPTTGDEEELVVFRQRRRWTRLGRRWRRPVRTRVAGLLRRKVGAAIKKMVKRLKEGRPFLGELFAGNYMFLQVTPSPTTAYVDKFFTPVNHQRHHHLLLAPPKSTRVVS